MGTLSPVYSGSLKLCFIQKNIRRKCNMPRKNYTETALSAYE